MADEFAKLGIIFTDTILPSEYPELFKQYFAKLVPPTDNKLAALNSAVWSGGTFILCAKKESNVRSYIQPTLELMPKNTGQSNVL